MGKDREDSYILYVLYVRMVFQYNSLNYLSFTVYERHNFNSYIELISVLRTR